MISGYISLKRNNFFLNTVFNFPGNGITVLFGPSGSGKSTFLKFLAGIEYIKSGYLVFNDVCLQSKSFFIPAYMRNFGYVSQNPVFFPNLSFKNNIFYGFLRTNFKRCFIDVKEVFDVFNLRTLVRKNQIKLSGGEKQRVMLARAILLNPDYLLLDEPVSALDKVAAVELLSYLWFLNSKFSIPIILVSHNMLELNLVANCYFEINRNLF